MYLRVGEWRRPGVASDCSSQPEDGTEQSEDRQDDRGECYNRQQCREVPDR